jgi:hypothetical protein
MSGRDAAAISRSPSPPNAGAMRLANSAAAPDVTMSTSQPDNLARQDAVV